MARQATAEVYLLNMSFIQSTYLSILKVCTQLQLAKYQPEIIGITGSAGKSSAVLATYLVLQEKYGDQVQYTKKGNSETGIPFEVLDIPVENYQGIRWIKPILLAKWHLLTKWPKYSLFVAEMGIDSDKSPKNMSYLLGMIQPSVGVLLNVSSVHGANFSGLDVVQSVANEKRKLLTALPKDGLAIYSADHPQILNNSPIILADQKTFTTDKEKLADMKLVEYEASLTGTTFRFKAADKKYVLHLLHQLHSKAAFGGFAAALLVGERFEIPLEESINTLSQHFTLPPGRMTMLEGISNSTIIDSSYNSSPEATLPALEMLKNIDAKGRKIVVLGDMRELGAATESAHKLLAEEAQKAADIIIWVGPLTKQFSYTYLQDQKTKKMNHAFDTAWDAIEPLKELLKPNDLVFVKGSQNTILLEIIVEALLKNSFDQSLLCRRSEYWQKQRLSLKKQGILSV